MISAEGSSQTKAAVGSYGGRSSSPGAGSGCLPATTPWNQCHSAPPRCSTSPAGVQPDGTTGRCHASSSSPAMIESTASRWAARKASRAWSSTFSFRLLVIATLPASGPRGYRSRTRASLGCSSDIGSQVTSARLTPPLPGIETARPIGHGPPDERHKKQRAREDEQNDATDDDGRNDRSLTQDPGPLDIRIGQRFLEPMGSGDSARYGSEPPGGNDRQAGQPMRVADDNLFVGHDAVFERGSQKAAEHGDLTSRHEVLEVGEVGPPVRH